MNDRIKLDDLLDQATPVVGSVRPAFYELGDDLKLGFECVSCVDMMDWSEGRWRCPGCDFVLGPESARILISESRKALDGLEIALSGGGDKKTKPGRLRRWWQCLYRIFSRRRPGQIPSGD